MRRMGFVVLMAILLAGPGCGYGSHNYMTGGGGGGAPTITQLVPSTATAGGPAFTLEIDGSGFGTDVVVYWNTVAQVSTYGTGTQVTAQITAADIMNAGMVPVYVRSGGKNSNTVNFNVQ